MHTWERVTAAHCSKTHAAFTAGLHTRPKLQHPYQQENHLCIDFSWRLLIHFKSETHGVQSKTQLRRKGP